MADVGLDRRTIKLPRYLRSVKGSGELAATLVEVCDELGLAKVAFLSGKNQSWPLAQGLIDHLGASRVLVCRQVDSNDERDVVALAEDEKIKRANAVIAVGGGKVIDVAKSLCRKLDKTVIVVPTLLSTDSVASPISVLRGADGTVDSFPARLPAAVLVDLDVITKAPLSAARAGFGDLLANRSAIYDWRLAASEGQEKVDDFAALLSESACDLAWSAGLAALGRGEVAEELIRQLLHGLVLSGLAMEIAGSSRPCSGSEHLISHAIDRLYPGTASHGEQVAFGAVLATHFQGGDWRAVRDRLALAGMGQALEGFGLSAGQIVAALQLAPETRPGRYTVLDRLDLSAGELELVVKEVIS